MYRYIHVHVYSALACTTITVAENEEVPNKWQDGRVFDIIEKSDLLRLRRIAN